MRERRHSSETRKLDTAELARLQHAAANEPVPPAVLPEGSSGRRAAGSQPPMTKPAANIVDGDAPQRARAETLHDPMTMALLAEVARSAPAPDAESDADAVVIDDPGAFDAPALNESIHPHVLRR